MRGEGLRIVDYLRWAELHIYMTVHELSLTRTRRSGQGPNRYTYELMTSPSVLSAEDSDTVSLTKVLQHPGVPALVSSSQNNTLGRCWLGISIASLWAAYGILDFTERLDRRSPVLLDKDYVPQLPLEIVLSMYQEPIDEVGKLISNLKSIPTLSDAHVTIYIKGSEANNTHVKQKTGANYVITLPNVGREGETFLNHILYKWDSLARQTIFLQAGIHNPREFYIHIKNYYNGSTGFLNLGWPGGVCDCENCSDRFSWRDTLHFLPQLHNQVYNSTRCDSILLSYKGQSIVSAARIRGINKDIYSGLSQAFFDKESWTHQPSYLHGRPDSMSAPDFGHTVERLWNVLFQCSGVDVAWKCPSLMSGWRTGGDISDCQCFDT
jgi:hypothetical protein